MERMKLYFLNIFENDSKKAFKIRCIISFMWGIMLISALVSLLIFRNSSLALVSSIILIISITFVNIYSLLYLQPIEILKNNSWIKVILANSDIYFLYMLLLLLSALVILTSLKLGLLIEVMCDFIFSLLFVMAKVVSKKISKYFESKLIK